MAQTYSLASRITLANGLTMPRIHLGLYLMSGREAKQAVHHALTAGYRGFDSAQMYHNERETGDAILSFLADDSINTARLTREDIHYTTKLASNTTYASARKSISQSVRACGLGYIDLLLLHSPYGGRDARLETWRAVEDAVADGEARIGGVSNFGIKHIEELVAASPETLPQINQIEVHPFNTREPLRATCAAHNIIVEAYAPLARALRMDHPEITAQAKKYGATPAQVMVRWSLQQGMVPLPKSVSGERIVENGEVGGFAISDEDVRRLSALDEELVTDWDPLDAE